MNHQYIERESGTVVTEKLIADQIVNRIYNSARENPNFLFRALTSRRMTGLLGFINYDFPIAGRLAGNGNPVESLGIDLSECLEPDRMNSPREVFERKIRYWENRPMPESPDIVVSPADSRVVAGSFSESSLLFLKEKFFHFEELLGFDKTGWPAEFHGGDYAIFRLTPEKYHYNHVPVSGKVVDIYETDGRYHSCNPGAVISTATPFSKNRRTVTVIDTDVSGGTNVGLVAMIEVVALMIGGIVQYYSENRYDSPRDVRPGMMLKRGQPKSLYRPGSSVDVLIFQKDRIRFAPDIIENMGRVDAKSRFSTHFNKPVVETDVAVRSAIARRRVTGVS